MKTFTIKSNSQSFKFLMRYSFSFKYNKKWFENKLPRTICQYYRLLIFNIVTTTVIGTMPCLAFLAWLSFIIFGENAFLAFTHFPNSFLSFFLVVIGFIGGTFLLFLGILYVLTYYVIAPVIDYTFSNISNYFYKHPIKIKSNKKKKKKKVSSFKLWLQSIKEKTCYLINFEDSDKNE